MGIAAIQRYVKQQGDSHPKRRDHQLRVWRTDPSLPGTKGTWGACLEHLRGVHAVGRGDTMDEALADLVRRLPKESR